MGWQFVESQQVPTGHPFPSPTLRFQAEFRWDGATNIEISSARLTASLPDILGTAWAEMPLPIGQPEVQPHRSTYVNIALPIDRRFIELVENWRCGRSVPVRLEGRADFTYREIETFELQAPRNEQGRERRMFRALGFSAVAQARFTISIQRDQWLTILKALGWNEFLVFEMSVRPLNRYEGFKKGFELLDHAQTALRQGQWAMAATESRKALEAAAAAVTPEGDQRKRFDALLNELLPDEHDEAKRAMLGSLMVALRDLRNEAAHGNNLQAQVEREDAELAFAVAVAVFRYMGDAMRRQMPDN
jgi:hypothetical protein